MKKLQILGVLTAAVLAVSSTGLPVMGEIPEGDEPEFTEDIAAENNIEDDTEAAGEYDTVRQELQNILSAKPIYALINCDGSYSLYDQAGCCGSLVGKAPSGTQVFIRDIELTPDGALYYLVTCGIAGETVEGYVQDGYIATEDREFCQWKEEVLPKLTGVCLMPEASNVDAIYANFPSGYHDRLVSIATAHPNWTFVAYNTDVEWINAVLAEREGNRSLVYKNVVDSWKSKEEGDYDLSTGTYIPKSGANWFRASQEAVDYCLNPLNYLDETHIFAFEQLTYDASIHNADGVNAIIRKSWMYDRALEDSSSGYYCDVFVLAGAITGVSPYHLASRVLQEQGLKGDAQLISGYGGVYNYFNVKASGATEEEILKSGTAYAQSQGWTTRYASILGGAQRLGENYITKGQDTLYLQKFDVDNSYYGMFSHQYMQNIQAPTTEGLSVYKAYSNAGALNNNFVFKIPVFKNMPGNGSAPTGAGDYPTSEGFIRQIYSVILDREPDQAGLNYWVEQMKNGETAADVVDDFFKGKEMTGKNLDDRAFMDYAYRAIMGRKPGKTEVEYWTSELDQGATRRWLLSEFVVSTEFTQLCQRFNIVRGTISNLEDADKSAGVSKFASRVYQNVLKRKPDASGLNYWAGQMLNNGMTASKLVEQFVNSPEFINSVNSDEVYIERLYETVLGRTAEQNGKNYWLSLMASGYSRYDILREFTRSQEFTDICANYGVVKGDL